MAELAPCPAPYEPLIGAGLVLEHDGHVAPGVQVAPGDVDYGSPRGRPSTGLQVEQPGNLKGVKRAEVKRSIVSKGEQTHNNQYKKE